MPSERTITSIRKQPRMPGDTIRDWAYYRCGCIDHGRNWTLCEYHLGFDDAATEDDRG